MGGGAGFPDFQLYGIGADAADDVEAIVRRAVGTPPVNALYQFHDLHGAKMADVERTKGGQDVGAQLAGDFLAAALRPCPRLVGIFQPLFSQAGEAGALLRAFFRLRRLPRRVRVNALGEVGQKMSVQGAGVFQAYPWIDAKAGDLLFAVEAVGGAPISPLGGDVQVEAVAVSILAGGSQVAAMAVGELSHSGFQGCCWYFFGRRGGASISTNKSTNKIVGIPWFSLIVPDCREMALSLWFSGKKKAPERR